MFEVDQQADLQIGHFQVVQHLANFVVCDFLDCFGIDDDQVETDQIGNVASNVHRLIDSLINQPARQLLVPPQQVPYGIVR